MLAAAAEAALKGSHKLPLDCNMGGREQGKVCSELNERLLQRQGVRLRGRWCIGFNLVGVASVPSISSAMSGLISQRVLAARTRGPICAPLLPVMSAPLLPAMANDVISARALR